jgi:hypothetical protein
MKYVYVIFFLALSTFQMFAQVPQIGKSMGRWTGFGLESMKANKAAGLDYIEITMNNVIGKDPQGAPQRAEILMAVVMQPYGRKRPESSIIRLTIRSLIMKGNAYP